MASMIWAQDLNGAIGRNNELLWHIPEDLQHFKNITTGYPVIMGSKTWESLPFKPLPKRLNAIVSRNPEIISEEFLGNSLVKSYESPEQALIELPASFVIGGGMLYSYFMNPELSVFELIDSLHITLVHDTVKNADAFAPSSEIVNQYFEIETRETKELLDRKSDRLLAVDFIKLVKRS